MSFLDDLKKNVTDLSESVAKKSSEIIETQKLKMQRSSLESDLRDSYVALGRLYEKRLAGSAREGSEEAVLLKKLTSVRASMAKIEDALLKLKGVVTCPGCGQSVSKTFEFCPKCGARMTQPASEGSAAKDASEAEDVRAVKDASEPEDDSTAKDASEAEAVRASEAQNTHDGGDAGEKYLAKEETHDEE